MTDEPNITQMSPHPIISGATKLEPELVRCVCIRTLDMDLVTGLGFLAIPAIKQWPKLRAFWFSPVKVLTMTAFFPAYRPARTITTLPAFILKGKRATTDNNKEIKTSIDPEESE